MPQRGPKDGGFAEPKQARTRAQLARILEVSDRLFAERGYEATKMEDIAAAVPCSISPIYDRFGGKAPLLRYMHRQGVEEAIGLLQAIDPGELEGDLRVALPNAVRMGLAVMDRYRGRRRASAERMHADPELAALELELQDHLISAGQRFLLAFRHQFQHPDPEVAALHAMRTLMAMTQQRGSGLPTPAWAVLSDERFVDEVTRMVLAYFGVSPSPEKCE